MIYYTQTDVLWKNDIMTEKVGSWRDLLGRWGCLVTSLANSINVLLDKNITPKELNTMIRDNKCYAYLNNTTTPENQASNLLLEKFLNLCFSQLQCIRNAEFNPEEHDNIQVRYIANITHPITKQPHFVSVVDVLKEHSYLLFDVETSKLQVNPVNNLIGIRRK
jgi:hypothetical protein